MDSVRLPGKVVLPLAGKPLLSYTIESLSRCTLVDELIVATSDRRVDDPIARVAAEYGADCFRGSADDVSSRLLEAAVGAELEAFARVSGDSPLIDHRLVDDLVARSGVDTDLVTNVFPRSYPAGQSVEVLATRSFGLACERMTDPADREHVTTFLYRHAEDFRILNVVAEPPLRVLPHLAVDTSEDLRRIERLIGRMAQPHWEYDVRELTELAG